MKKEEWVTAALTNDAMVADLLIRMKQPSSLHSSQPTTSLRWSHRKSRSKPNDAATAASGFRKEEQQSGSPTTPLCWSDESTRPSDLSSGGARSIKGALGNEGATTSSYKKSRKRKAFAELKEEEDFLLKERLHLNRELKSMRVTMSNQIATSQNYKKFKIDNPKKEMEKMYKEVNHRVTKSQETGFVLPDLNMIPDEEEFVEEISRI